MVIVAWFQETTGKTKKILAYLNFITIEFIKNDIFLRVWAFINMPYDSLFSKCFV